MAWSDLLYLIEVVHKEDSSGFPVPGIEKETKVFANRKSVKSNEYYAAKQSGIQLSLIFEVRAVEYDGQTKLRYNDIRYEVERSYEIGEFVELTCKREGETHETRV